MNMAATLELYSGGLGSGCNPDAARRAGTKCGRPLRTRNVSRAKPIDKYKNGDVVELDALKPEVSHERETWASGWLTKEGKVYIEWPHANVSPTPNGIRFTTGDYFEYPLLDIRSIPTEAQLRSIARVYQYVRKSPDWWDYGVQYSIKFEAMRKGVFKEKTTMGQLLRDLEKLFGPRSAWPKK